ncbi:RHS repeat-associated core domain-containing protein [Pseudomonas fluorescens]|uniref:RHS repeat-associated core domain-containing protein n=1 Tax=Pseudomonas fluorescens TaxID=294 RepID=UPI0009B909E5|nr:RHS repeat-associated core domain-containing protein [Pseudomonas fluorescens]
MPSQNKTLLCCYHYDPLDRLIGLNSAKPDTLQRFYCKSRLATEIQGLARCSIVQQGDQLLAQQKRLGDSLETALLATDQQRSVMDTVGGSSLAIAYSPYGHRRAESGFTSLLGFNGERPDTITGHYLLGNGYRAFNPVFMRFNSPDSLSPFGDGGLNSYAYCSGDPVNFSDPTGNIPWHQWTTRQVTKMSKATREVGQPLFPETNHVSKNHAPFDLPDPPVPNRRSSAVGDLPSFSEASSPKHAKETSDFKTLQERAFEKLPRQKRSSAHPVVKKTKVKFYDKKYDERPLLTEMYVQVGNSSNKFSHYKVHVYKLEVVLAELRRGHSRHSSSPYSFRLDARVRE